MTLQPFIYFARHRLNSFASQSRIFVLVEMVAPLVDHFEAHEAVLQEHINLGYSAATDLVDAAHAGDRTSHHRWFMLASKA